MKRAYEIPTWAIAQAIARRAAERELRPIQRPQPPVGDAIARLGEPCSTGTLGGRPFRSATA